MKHFPRAIVLFLAISLSAVALCQSHEAEAEKSSKILDHIRDVDLLNKLLPIVWTKAELNAILPEIEKVRQKIKDTHHQEYLTLVAVDAKATAAVDKALLDGNLPGKALMNELEASLDKMSFIRMTL